ncbi:MAG: YggS family pyridoxal phosphate-dependent enzyme [Gammaproteobacteria bacterium]|nr:YggS family pyridoxal phosphate-dependent enzyme [Gammaproteobacteria bacterium]
MKPTIESRLEAVRAIIAESTAEYTRATDAVQLLAVSKTRSAEEILEALAAGQRCFGESYLQEAIDKIDQLRDEAIEWHFIGRVQSNKTRQIAEKFDWVHSIDKLKHAQRLNDQRPDSMPPLNICLQINIDNEATKGGVEPDQAAELIQQISTLPRLQLRGVMTLPSPTASLDEQRIPFRRLRELRDRLATEELPLDTLSIGMSDDIPAAIAEGSTIVRVGTAIFGPRNYQNRDK